MLTVGITTFEHRFETYFKPLLKKIKEIAPEEMEIIVTVNGEHKQKFNQNYRKEMLAFCAEYDNVFPIFFPQFRGLSKLWNTIMIHASNDDVLLLNDDITITVNNILGFIEWGIVKYDTSFKINSSWSHVLLNKQEVMDVGFFDERLLGIGEEDGDFEWRYNKLFGRSFMNVPNLGGIHNHVDMTHAPTNITAGSSGKYSKFNRDTLFKTIYHEDQNMGKAYGMIGEKLIENHRKEQYPYEQFYKDNKDKI